MNRRIFLCNGLFYSGALLLSPLCRNVFAEQGTLTIPGSKTAIMLAVQTWTFREFDIDEGIRKIHQAGVEFAEISGGITVKGTKKRASQMTADEKKWLRGVMEENHVCAVSLGGCQGTVEEFDFATEMGLRFLQGEPPVEKLVEVSKRAEKYGIKFSLHNHPKPSRYWDYRESLKRIQDCTPWLGFCPDTGHMIRSGIDPLQAIRDLKGKIISMHLKDLDTLNNEAAVPPTNPHDVPWGTGVGQVETILKELESQAFQGPVMIEYEYHWADNLEEVTQCAAFFQKTMEKISTK